MRLKEFAPSGGGGSGDYFQALASAWYNGTFDTGSLQKGIKSKEDVERLLQRGVLCPDGVTRKFGIDYNADFDGVEIYSDDYYEHGDYDDTIDSRTGQKWGPYDFMAFSDEELSEGLNEFAPPGDGDGGDDGFDDEMLKRLAAQWWNGDEDPRVERTLAAAGWEIGQDEGSYDNGGAFVVQAGDVNGDSYISWPAEELEQGMAEGLPQTLRKIVPGYAKREIDKKMDAEKFGKTDVDRDANYYRYKKIQDKIKEQGVAEGSLEEIDRRGFLKGMGAAAVAGAGAAAPEKAKAEEFTIAVRRMLVLYYMCKDPEVYPNNPEIKSPVCNRVQASIKKFASRNDVGPMGKSKGSMILNSWYQGVKSEIDKLKADDISTNYSNDYRYAHKVGDFWRAAPQIISDFESLNEFNESVNQGVAEGSDPWGSQGRFVGDTGPTQVSTTVPRVQLRIGDRVLYKPTEQRATIEALSKDGTKARIHIPSPMGGRIFNCMVADLKALGALKEKSTSQAQFRTMAAAAHDPKFARKVGIKQSVAQEFNKADKGQSYKSLPKKAN